MRKSAKLPRCLLSLELLSVLGQAGELAAARRQSKLWNKVPIFAMKANLLMNYHRLSEAGD